MLGGDASYPLRCKSILPVFLKLQTLFSYLRNFTNFWRGNKVLGTNSGNSDEEAHVDLLHQSNVALLFEEGDIGGYPVPQYRKKKWQIPKYLVENRLNTDTAYFNHIYNRFRILMVASI